MHYMCFAIRLVQALLMYLTKGAQILTMALCHEVPEGVRGVAAGIRPRSRWAPVA